MILDKEVKLGWGSKNKKHYEELGYVYTSIGNEFFVKVSDLLPCCSVKVLVQCDICKVIRKIKYTCYYESMKRNEWKIYKCDKCTKNLSKPSFLCIKSLFEENDYILLSDYSDYKNNRSKLRYLCPKHGEQQICWGKLVSGRRCPKCGRESMIRLLRGENSYLWKGGISALSRFLREKATCEWKRESLKQCNYKCVITKKPYEVLHHLYPYHRIFKEFVEETKIRVHPTISFYSDSELEEIKNLFEIFHNKYPFGVGLTNNIHTLFHNIYKDDFLPEDFYNFKREFDLGRKFI